MSLCDFSDLNNACCFHACYWRVDRHFNPLDQQDKYQYTFILYVAVVNSFRSVTAGIRGLLKQGSIQKVYNGLQGY